MFKVLILDLRMFKECNLAYKSLKSNSKIIISKADKVSSFVILNKDDYIMKMNTILDDKTKFVKLGTTDTSESTVKIKRAFSIKTKKMVFKGIYF